ncbi:ubiquitin carboxyl-terminal hydrolase [Apiospora arundinis]
MPSASATVASRANGFPTPPSANGHGGRRGPLPHIDDLTSVAVNLNPHTPLRKFLEVGDKHMRQAITYNDFRRPDLALQEFITAFTIAVDKIPKHKDYPSLKTGNGDLSRLYNALKANITNHCTTFDKIKEDIKEDNRKSGVQPRNGSDSAALSTIPSVPSAVPSHMRSNSANGIPSGALLNVQSTPAGKAKPAVQPKPHALHGNAIRSSAKPVSQELLNRFARLRDPQVPSSGSPTSSPSTLAGADQRQLPKIDSALPSMPKLPDAIYSPARGTVTSETANLPSSTPRGMFSRTNSINSVPSSARNSIDIPIRPTISEIFVPAHALGDGAPSTLPTTKSHIPHSETITPEDLKNYMGQGSTAIRLMLVDVRSREDYDEGHIFAQTSICIEPSVLARGEVSASDIEDSLGIAPDEEMQAFESRAQFDLVVFYDQSSSSIPKRPSEHQEEMALFTLYQALVHFDYPIKLRRPPKLLNGGVDAWVDMFGPQSLRESKTNTAAQHLKPRSLQASKTGVITLAADEIKTWKEAAARNQVDYITSTNDFLRRYPAIGEHQESMSSDYNGTASLDHHRRTNKAFENELPPTPPARPAPALPRTSYSGVSTREPASDVVFAKSARAAATNNNIPTGLVNEGMKCYANSLIQCLLASPGFAREFTDKDWPANWAPGEEKDPQLMARILGNLLQWLCGRQFKSLKATTLFNYSYTRHQGYNLSGSGTLRFGDRNQHDPTEYIKFIFLQLDAETNRRRGAPEINWMEQPRTELEASGQAVPPVGELAQISWGKYSACHQSVIDRHWGLGVVTVTRCDYPGCNETTEAFEWPHDREVYLGDGQDKSKPGHDAEPINLVKCLDERVFTTEKLRVGIDSPLGYDCGRFKNPPEIHTVKTKTTWLTRAPRLLDIQLIRERKEGEKVSAAVDFEVELDLRKYMLEDLGNVDVDGLKQDGFNGEMTYELYGVISHRGRNANAGHYISYIRQGPGQTWYLCNDEHVEARTLDQVQKIWAECQGGFTPKMLFYKRKDIGWDYAQPPDGMQ